MMKERVEKQTRTLHDGSSGRIAVTLLSVLLAIILTAAVTLYLTRRNRMGGEEVKKGKVKESLDIGTAFNGGTFEASGAVQVSAMKSILFVDDSRPSEAFLMQIDESGQQVGEIKPIKLGVKVENPEGITFDESHFYIVGSQSNPKDGERNAIARFKLDQNSQSVSGVDVIKDLRGLLLDRVPELKGEGEKKGEKGGLNIEGIAWDPERKQLLLGLRSPIIDGQALIVPMRLRDPNGPFSADNLQLEHARAMRLSLGGSGIRDIQYDSKLKSFLLISGAPENEEKGDFVLWQWDGRSDASQPRQMTVLGRKVKPEGIAPVRIGERDFIFIVCDASRYLKLDYSDE